jgi:hypothetical protein
MPRPSGTRRTWSTLAVAALGLGACSSGLHADDADIPADVPADGAGEADVLADGGADDAPVADAPDDGAGDEGPDVPGETGDADGEAAAPTRVLFVGNSYTEVNDLPGRLVAVVESLAGSGALAVESVTVGGATLAIHLATTGAREAIRRGGWSYVVLQGQSLEPVLDRAGFLSAAAALAAEVSAVGAVPVFYETWARRAGDAVYAGEWSGGTPEALQAGLREAYAAAATAAGGLLAPVGDAWEATLAAHPELVLHASDGSHPTSAGTYLAACVFLAVLTGRDPRGAGGVPPDVPADQAALLQAIAAATTTP